MDAILSHLSKINGLRVISSTSMGQYRNTKKSIPEIGRELHVANILEGSVQRHGELVRIKVQLIDAEKDQHIWSENYDRKLEDIFDLQSEIARKDSEELSLKLSPEEKLLITRKPTSKLTAYDYYLRGKDYLRNSNLHLAKIFLRRAITLDTNFDDAYVQLGWAHRYLSIPNDSVLMLANKALEINPDNANAYVLRANYNFQLKWIYFRCLN